MKVTSSIRTQRKDSPMSDRKEGRTMNAKIDQRRIFIFIAIAYGISIALGLVIFSSGGLSTGDGLFFLRDTDEGAVRVRATVARVLPLTGTTHEGLSHTLKEMQPRRSFSRVSIAYRAWV